MKEPEPLRELGRDEIAIGDVVQRDEELDVLRRLPVLVERLDQVDRLIGENGGLRLDDDSTRRLAQALEWLAEGKRRNWKYESC
mgnify:CR=1 FL=1